VRTVRIHGSERCSASALASLAQHGRLVECGYAAWSVVEWWEIDYWKDHPNPSDDDIADLCRAWVRYQGRNRGSQGTGTDDIDRWACDAVIEVDGESTDLEWRVIRGLCATVDPGDEWVVIVIGAGPLEDFLSRQGGAAMDLIESVAASDAVLLAALGSVWESREPLRSRIARCLAAGGPPSS